MPNFSYRAYDRGGSPIRGMINAAGAREAVQELRSTGLYPTEVKESGTAGGLSGPRVKGSALAAFTRQLATLISAGTNLSDALSVIAENTDNRNLRAVIADVKEAIAGGSSLARALENHKGVFSPLYRGLAAAAEASGSFDSVLPRLADYLEKRARIAGEVRAALTYPALMTAVGTSVLSFLFIFVVPKIARIFEETGADLPFMTVVLMRATDIMTGYWHAIIAALAAAVWILVRKARSGRGSEVFDALVLRLPWFGPIVLSFHVAALARTLGSLLKGGVQLLKSLEITAGAVGSPAFKKVLATAARECTEGAALSASLRNSGVLPPVVVHMIGVGERSGSLDEMLLRVADAYDAEFENGVKRTLNLLEPLLILVMGAVVGFIVLAMLLPIFELNQVIR